MAENKTPSSRLVKSEKAEFALVNEHFSDKHNEEIGVLFLTLITGCSTVGSMLGLGPRGRRFKSGHPDCYI